MDISFFLFSFSSLFALVNPIGISPAFVSFTERFSKDDVLSIAKRSVMAALLILLLFAVLGDLIFSLYGITIHAFRIVGGILFFRSGLKMLESIPSRTRTTPKEEKEALTKHDIAISPIAIPLIAGPGAITSSMILFSHADTMPMIFAFGSALLLVMLATYFILRGAEKLLDKIGTTGSRVIQRLMGLLLMVIAVQFIIDGVTPVAQEILRGTG